jgi:5'-nucleotidase
MTNLTPQVLVTNDDGSGARGIDALTAALLQEGLDVVVVAPAINQSGVSRTASYSKPVRVEAVDGVAGADSYVCHGSPVDCVRVAIVGDIAPRAAAVVSGINHGGNFGDDTLGSGTFGAAVEGGLLGLPALAVSQQSYPGHFSLLDALDQSTPVYQHTGTVAALITRTLLEGGAPDRAVLNLNMPAEFTSGRIEVTRPGRRFWRRDAVPGQGSEQERTYLTFGTREAPDAEWQEIEFASGTDFDAVRAGSGSLTPFSYDWTRPGVTPKLANWAQAIAVATNERLARVTT